MSSVHKVPDTLREFLQPLLVRDMLDQKILRVLDDSADEHGCSNISQARIAKRVGVHQPLVSTHIKNLIKHGFVAQGGRCRYKVLRRDIEKNGATSSVLRYLEAVMEDSSLVHLSIEQQSKRTGLTVLQIEMAQGYVASDTPV